MAQNEKSVFDVLNAINVNEHIEVIANGKRELKYLSWAWAWHWIKTSFPNATYTIYENANGLNYHTDGRTCWVKTGLTIEGVEYIEYLPVMDNRHDSIMVDKVTSFDVNKAIQRSLTKAAARHGLGLYVYAGEDLPFEVKKENDEKEAKELAASIAAIKACVSRAEMKAVWDKNVKFHQNQTFRDAAAKKGEQFKDEKKQEGAK